MHHPSGGKPVGKKVLRIASKWPSLSLLQVFSLQQRKRLSLPRTENKQDSKSKVREGSGLLLKLQAVFESHIPTH